MPGWSQVGKKKRSLDQMPKKRQIKAPRVVGREENVFADLDDSLSDAAHGCSSGGEWCSGDERLRGKQKEILVNGQIRSVDSGGVSVQRLAVETTRVGNKKMRKRVEREWKRKNKIKMEDANADTLIAFLLGLLPPLREFDQPDASSAILASWSDQEIDELLECKICYTLRPVFKQLPCPHRYCSECVDQLEKIPGPSSGCAGPESICCPECRVPCDTGLITYDVKTLQKLLERSARCTHFLHGCDWKGPLCHRPFHPCSFEEWAEEKQQQQMSGGSSGSKTALLDSPAEVDPRLRDRPPRPTAPKVAAFSGSAGANIVSTPSLAKAPAASRRLTKGLVPPVRPKGIAPGTKGLPKGKASHPLILDMPQTWQQLTKKQRAQLTATTAKAKSVPKAPTVGKANSVPKAAIVAKVATVAKAGTVANAGTVAKAATATKAPPPPTYTATIAASTTRAVLDNAASVVSKAPTATEATTPSDASKTTPPKAVTAQLTTTVPNTRSPSVLVPPPDALLPTPLTQQSNGPVMSGLRGAGRRVEPNGATLRGVRSSFAQYPSRQGANINFAERPGNNSLTSSTAPERVSPLPTEIRDLRLQSLLATTMTKLGPRRVNWADEVHVGAPVQEGVSERYPTGKAPTGFTIDGPLSLTHGPGRRAPQAVDRRGERDRSMMSNSVDDELDRPPNTPSASRSLKGGAFERTDLDLAGGVESDHHQGALRGDPQSLARSAQNVAVGELDEAKPKTRDEKPRLVDSSGAKKTPTKPSRPPRPRAPPVLRHPGSVDYRLERERVVPRRGTDGMDRKSIAQPCKPSRPPSIPRSISNEDHETQPVGSSSGEQRPTRPSHKPVLMKALTMRGLVVEIPVPRSPLPDGATCPECLCTVNAETQGKLPLGIHLLPLINLSDLEHIGDLPSLPESFEMAQAAPPHRAVGTPSSLLETSSGGKEKFWESVDLPQDLVAEVMKRMKQHHHHKHRAVPLPDHDHAWLLNQLKTLAAIVDAQALRDRGAELKLAAQQQQQREEVAPPDAFHDIMAAHQQGGIWRDFMGPCSAFVPYAKAVLVGDLGVEECWRRCTQQYFFCTQTHYAAAGQTCYFGHGLSTLLDTTPAGMQPIGGSLDTCRSLTELGFRELRSSRIHSGAPEAPEDDVPNLSPFTVVPGSGRYLLVQPNVGIVEGERAEDEETVRVERADTFLQCQSNCLASDWCATAVWIDRGSEGSSICAKGSMLLPGKSTTGCPMDGRCMEVCGGQDCVPSIRNPSGISTLSWRYPGEAFDFIVTVDAKAPEQTTTFGCSDSDCVDGIKRCHMACHAASCRGGWIEVVAERDEVKCFLSSGFPAVAGSGAASAADKGVTSSPAVCPLSARACLMFASDYMMLPRPMIQAAQVWLEQSPGGSPRGGNGIAHQSAGMGADIEVLSGWGRCMPFHAGLSASPDSSFVARDRWECWRLCREMNAECTQVEYHNNTNVCVLGNGVASRVEHSKNGAKSKSPVFCHSIRKGPSPTHGLPGMMIVGSITGAESGNHWFRGYQGVEPGSFARETSKVPKLSDVCDFSATTLVETLEECQTLCEKATDEATNADCRYGGFESCRAVRAACRGNAAGRHGGAEECKMCKNDKGGICRIGSETKPGGSGVGSDECLSGACKWFEMGAVGFRVKAASEAAKYVDHLPLNSSGLICPQGGVVKRDVLGRCYHSVESMWHCHALCEAQTGECMGGLYVDSLPAEGGVTAKGKWCYLAMYLRYHASDYEDAKVHRLFGSSNCAAFTRDGVGKLPTLRVTGSIAADQAVERAPQGAVNMTGVCNEFDELDNTMMEGSPADFSYNPMYACSMRCLTMLQCMSFKVEGYPEDDCDLHSHRPNVSAGCETITCRFSSALASKATKVEIRPGEYAKNAICVSRGVDAAKALSVDSDVRNGIPGFYTVNAMARKFRWADVLNKRRLTLTPHLEGCQSICRGKKQCKTGTWQSCGALKDVCSGGTMRNPEMNKTCGYGMGACTGIVVSEDRAPEDYPDNMGVCKLASAVSHAMFNCGATSSSAGCYAFEKGRDNFVIMSSYASPFIEEDASSKVNTSLIEFEGEKGAYGKVLDLDACEYYCEKDPLCTYGHFAPKGIGFGDCYLTHSTDVDTIDTSTIENRPILEPRGWSVKRCDGVCVVFKKVVAQDEGQAVTNKIDEVIDTEEQEVQPDVVRSREEEPLVGDGRNQGVELLEGWGLVGGGAQFFFTKTLRDMLTTLSAPEEGQQPTSSCSSSPSSPPVPECPPLSSSQQGASLPYGEAFKRPRLDSELMKSAACSPGRAGNALQLLADYSTHNPTAVGDVMRPSKKPLSSWYLQCIEEDIVVAKRLVERRRLPLRGLIPARQDLATAEEHLVFLEGLRDHGRDWNTITSYIPTRTTKQVRSHAQKYFQDLDRRWEDEQEEDGEGQSRGSQPEALIQHGRNDRSLHQDEERQKAIEELLRSLNVARPVEDTGPPGNMEDSSGWNQRHADVMATKLSLKRAVEAVSARSGDSMRAMLGPASGMESAEMSSSNLELAALAAVAANLTSLKRGVQDGDARVAAAPFTQGIDLSALAAAASAMSSSNGGEEQRSPSLGLETARSIGLLTGGDVLAMDSHLTFVGMTNNMKSVLNHFTSALTPATGPYEEVTACVRDVEAHLHECRAWAPIMTEKLHSTGQELYARTSMLFEKYMDSNNSSPEGASPSHNNVQDSHVVRCSSHSLSRLVTHLVIHIVLSRQVLQAISFRGSLGPRQRSVQLQFGSDRAVAPSNRRPDLPVTTALTLRLSEASRTKTSSVPTLPCHTELSAEDIVDVNQDPVTRISCNTTSVAVKNDKVHRPFCFGFKASTNASTQLPSPFVEVELKAPYVIRAFQFEPVHASDPDADNEGSTKKIKQPLPKSIKLNAAMGVHAFQWYRDLQAREHSVAWTSLSTEPEGPHTSNADVDLETDFRGHLLRIWPRAELTRRSDMMRASFQMKLYGCPVKDTRTMQLRFRSSFNSIRNKFKSLDIFRKELISHICRLLTLSTASATTTCSRILFIDVSEKSAAEFEHHREDHKVVSQRIQSYEPSKDHIPNVVVNLRVLPPVAQCIDCRECFILPEWVTDDTPYFCSKVQCNAEQDCVNGVCIDRIGRAHDRLRTLPALSESHSRFESADLINWDREDGADKSRPLISNFGADIPKYRYDDTLLQLKPLPLIKGADEPPQAHFVTPQSLKPSSNGVGETALEFQSEAEPASSDKAFHKRYTMSLIIAGSLLGLLILAVSVRKARGMSLA
ncbi:hypothetical protein Pmar_PMAR029022 [Perkinsus marinus ATCC 50983]|uniref:RING-type domain-containing protein n=1 Tax=Perkinsus marinus (strain ATCC 50983 / TXsc) TaxID=423536 RepID=C5L6A6_PERM5|nr:hypothetical protein Pmar_PMAR029022 [Perkinsus marinus ATCC 50983]EER07733.1 hypothetical protein Pmar_PMAR029022 [Perkinsus marinus ATCC 50983]|eukprot:XP_002775917.1 hypothetical protein Pmar_PMAR029022 [Perkinsus marinus ATCC 50983]